MVVKCTFMKGDFDIKFICASLNGSLNASLNGTFETFGPKVYYFCQNTSGWPFGILNNHNWFKRTNIYKLSAT